MIDLVYFGLHPFAAVKLFFFFFPFALQVKTLKEKIEQEKGNDNFPVAGQKLIYAGMLLKVFIFQTT